MYRGRFAPSPTGPLHFGSLVAALGSFLDARHNGGEWLVRMEDLDPPREVPGAADEILYSLDALGLHWDADVLFQSKRTEIYEQVLEMLDRAELVYPCGCTRKEIRSNSAGGKNPSLYPGTCRNGLPDNRQARSVRLRVPDLCIQFNDRLQGVIEECLPEHSGDFIVRRADGLFAYQLAVVVDDAAQGITDIVRGSDLLDSTCRQIFLQQSLGYAVPRYLHLPIAVNAAGQKLSKQTYAPALDRDKPVPALWQTLQFLGQNPPLELQKADLTGLWQWAISEWNPAKLPRQLAISE